MRGPTASYTVSHWWPPRTRHRSRERPVALGRRLRRSRRCTTATCATVAVRAGALALVDGSRVSSYAQSIPRIAALVLVVAAVLAVIGLVVTLTRAGEERLDRGELEAKLE